MNQIVTQGIVLSRTNFGEADRIITMLTPDHGKIRLMAKGVRKIKSKLAGGIELFSVSNITYLPGKGDIGTLVSSRLERHYGHIVQDLPRTMLGYELLKKIDRATEDAAEPEYFTSLDAALQALDTGLSHTLLEVWFDARLLTLAGHQPNLATDTDGHRLQADQRYTFDFEQMSCAAAPQGLLAAEHIKFLRLVFRLEQPLPLAQLADVERVLEPCARLVSSLRQQFIRH